MDARCPLPPDTAWLIYADRMALKMTAPGGARDHSPVRVEHSPALRKVALPACAVVLALVVAGTIQAMLGQVPPVIAAAAAALLVTVGGAGWIFLTRNGPVLRSLAGLTAVGLAGAVLTGLLPSGTGYLAIFIALIGLGMELPPRMAIPSGLIVFLAANLSFLLAARLSLASLVSQDVAAAFLFTVGAFTRSVRVSQARARAAQARAEDLLAQLRASQAAQAEAAALAERTRLAREIHDILAHSLSGLILALDIAALLGRRGDDPGGMARILDQVTRAQRIAREGLADTRRAISALRGGELPGPALLDQLVRETSEATGLHAELTVAGDQRPLLPEIGLALYRTAQEALINTAKYAGHGGRAELRLGYCAGAVQLTVEDTPAAGAVPPNHSGLTFGGYGLTGMRERAELLGGTLTAGPTERGFRVVLWLPTGPAPRREQAA
jgi:signal transduction histidine kinase